MKEQRNLRTWFVAKNNVHDLSGVENPEQWKWERIDGVFYPAEKIEVHEPTAEEVKLHEITCNCSQPLTYGVLSKKCYRCGHPLKK